MSLLCTAKKIGDNIDDTGTIDGEKFSILISKGGTKGRYEFTYYEIAGTSELYTL